MNEGKVAIALPLPSARPPKLVTCQEQRRPRLSSNKAEGVGQCAFVFQGLAGVPVLLEGVQCMSQLHMEVPYASQTIGCLPSQITVCL